MVQIDEAAARALMRFGEDVLDIDSRSRCSDKYFRQHFTMIAKNPYVCDAFLALKRSIVIAAAEGSAAAFVWRILLGGWEMLICRPWTGA